MYTIKKAKLRLTIIDLELIMFDTLAFVSQLLLVLEKVYNILYIGIK